MCRLMGELDSIVWAPHGVRVTYKSTSPPYNCCILRESEMVGAACASLAMVSLLPRHLLCPALLQRQVEERRHQQWSSGSSVVQQPLQIHCTISDVSFPPCCCTAACRATWRSYKAVWGDELMSELKQQLTTPQAVLAELQRSSSSSADELACHVLWSLQELSTHSTRVSAARLPTWSLCRMCSVCGNASAWPGRSVLVC